jgi:ABC-type multidrug transport system ATPase subunit
MEETAIEMGQIKGFDSLLSPKTLAFSGITYDVKVTNSEDNAIDEKRILDKVGGEIKGGSMLCILGPSGSGKTSLIQIISGRIKTTKNGSHKVDGTIKVDGQVLTTTAFRRISGLVTQEDIFNDVLTVEETLQYAAELTLEENIRKSRVEEVISALHMESCRNTYIGDDANPYLKGISGGEKRRLAIALEILDPTISIIMLDEPTSGLDAAAAQNVANVLRALADKGMAVLATLHQPRTTIMNRFDQLMILAKGRSIYNGSRVDYVNYLQYTLGMEIPTHESPYDLMLDALNPAISKDLNLVINKLKDKDNTKINVADELANIYELSDINKNINEALLISASAFDGNVITTDIEKPLLEQISRWLHVTKTLLYRTFTIKLRDPICTMTQISSAIIMGLIFGMLYWKCYDKENVSFAIADTQMGIVMTVMMAVWLPYDVTLTFPKERRIFLRERKAGLYSTSAFYVARITADTPSIVLSAFLMGLIIFYMMGLTMSFGGFSLIMIWAIIVGTSIMQLVGAIARTFEEANIYMMVILMMSMMLGSGFVREVPSFLQWARDVSVMGVAADMALYLEFKNVANNDKISGMSSSDIYSQYGIRIQNDDELWDGALTMFYILIVARILAYLAVKFMFTGRTYEEDMKD